MNWFKIRFINTAMSRDQINELSRSSFIKYLSELKAVKGITTYRIQKDLKINSGTLSNYCSGKRKYLSLDVITVISITYNYPYTSF